MSKLSAKEDFSRELTDLEDKFREITGKEMPKYYRPPQGIYSSENLKMAQELGYRTVFWSLAYVDWYKDKQPTKEEAFSKLIPRIHPGSIVLLHNTSQTNADILDISLIGADHSKKKIQKKKESNLSVRFSFFKCRYTNTQSIKQTTKNVWRDK